MVLTLNRTVLARSWFSLVRWVTVTTLGLAAPPSCLSMLPQARRDGFFVLLGIRVRANSNIQTSAIQAGLVDAGENVLFCLARFPLAVDSDYAFQGLYLLI